MAAQTLLSHTAYNLIIHGRSTGNGLGVPVGLQRSAWEAEDAEANWQPAGSFLDVINRKGVRPPSRCHCSHMVGGTWLFRAHRKFPASSCYPGSAPDWGTQCPATTFVLSLDWGH